MQGAKVYVGVDVGSDYLEAARGKQWRRFWNKVEGHKELASWVQGMAGAVQVICEASGGYERELVQALQQSGISVSLVQASRVRQFARARGLWAKTDRIDAQLLALYGEAIGPVPTRALSLEQERLRALERQRRHLSRLLVMEQNRQRQLQHKELRALEGKLINQIKKQLAQLDELIAQMIAHSEELSLKAAKLTQIRGWSAHRRFAFGANARAGKTQPRPSGGSGRSSAL